MFNVVNLLFQMFYIIIPNIEIDNIMFKESLNNNYYYKQKINFKFKSYS